MATQIFRKVAYGFSQPLLEVPQGPVIATRNPKVTDRAQLGTEWVNTTANNAFFLTSIVDNQSTWVPISSSTSQVTFDTDSGTAITVDDTIDIAGGTNINTSGSGSTVTINLDSSIALTNLTLTGFTGGVLTSNGSGVVGEVATTNHSLLVGNASGTITSLGVATNGQIPIGATGANPTLATITQGTGVTITNGAGSITIAASGSVPITFDADSGTATPASGIITMSGGTGISTAATGSTVTYTLTTPVTVPHGGTGATTLTGILVGNGASAVTANTVTQYDVLVGGASNAITSVSPSTAGFVLTSNGTSANPTFQAAGTGGSITLTGDSGGALTGSSFTITGGSTGLTFAGSGTTETLGGTVVVAHGGTGDTSFTVYAPLCGGTTTTGVLQSASTGISTSGNVLTSNGASALPSWQAVSGTGITSIAGSFGTAQTGPAIQFLGGVTKGEGTASFSSTSNVVTLVTGDGLDNTAWGHTSLSSGSVTGTSNSTFGFASLPSLTTGTNNASFGYSSGEVLTTGQNNCFYGANSGVGITSGTYNVMIGQQAGFNDVTGTESSNIYLNSPGVNAESHALRIGTGTGTGTTQLNKSFIAGIQTVTVIGTAVLVSTSDQLGVAASSARFKENIQDMGSASEALYKLRPVSFTWNKKSSPGLADATDLPQYGLIAEESVTHIPHAVNLDKDGAPFNINYQDLIGMMINEIQRLKARIDVLEQKDPTLLSEELRRAG